MMENRIDSLFLSLFVACVASAETDRRGLWLKWEEKVGRAKKENGLSSIAAVGFRLLYEVSPPPKPPPLSLCSDPLCLHLSITFRLSNESREEIKRAGRNKRPLCKEAVSTLQCTRSACLFKKTRNQLRTRGEWEEGKRKKKRNKGRRLASCWSRTRKRRFFIFTGSLSSSSSSSPFSSFYFLISFLSSFNSDKRREKLEFRQVRLDGDFLKWEILRTKRSAEVFKRISGILLFLWNYSNRYVYIYI